MRGHIAITYFLCNSILPYAKEEKPAYTSLVDAVEPKTSLILMTWNVENFDSRADSKHKTSVRKSLEWFVAQYSPDVIALQEIEKCSLVNDIMSKVGYACVDTTIPAAVEARVNTVLGGVILHKTSIFEARNKNRIESDTQWRNELRTRRDKQGKTLEARHTQECTWGAYNQCQLHSDVLRTNSVALFPIGQLWQSELLSAFKDGLRIFSVHLFSGAYTHGLTDDMRLARRAFQMRSLLWLTDLWNANDRTKQNTTTAYLGDFNTLNAQQLQRVVAAAPDYDIDPWCPAEGGSCENAKPHLKTHKAGYLDHIVLDVEPKTLRDNLDVSARVLQQQGNHHSDHDPLLLQITFVPGAGRSQRTSFPLVILFVVVGIVILLTILACLWYQCMRKPGARSVTTTPAARRNRPHHGTEMSGSRLRY